MKKQLLSTKKIIVFFQKMLFVMLLLLNHSYTNAQIIQGGIPYIQNYNDEDYHTPINQNWAVIQDQRGVMYFGNSSGLLEFDGTNWRLIEMPNKSIVRSLAINSTGKIYVGAKSEFGYIEADTTGTMQYISLLNKVPEVHRNFDDVWQTFILNNQVVFRTNYSIYILKENKINILKSCKKFHVGFCINNQFYVREWGKGLLQLINDSLKLVHGSEQFANERIYVMLPFEDDKILIVTRTQGIFIYSKPLGFLKPQGFEKADNFLIKNQIYCGIKLNDEYFVLGTIQDGLIIIDKQGNIVQHFNKETGLQDNSIWCMYINSQNNIWAGLDNGISYLTLNLPFRFFNEKMGLQGSVYSAIVSKNQLYAGTMLGIFRKNKQNNFVMLENSKGPCWHLAEINKVLYSGHFEGILKIDESSAKNIAPIGNIWTFFELVSHPNYVLAGTSDNGLMLLEHKNGKLLLKNKIKGFDESSSYVQEDNKGNIWVSHVNKGVFKLKLNEALDSVAELSFYNAEYGLPSNTFNFVFKIKTENNNSKIVFGTENGIYEYNTKTNRFFPDTIFNNLLENKGTISSFTQDQKGNIYFKNDDKAGLFVLQDGDKYKLEKTLFLKLKSFSYEDNIIVIDTSNILFCTCDGIIHYNPLIIPDYNAIFPVLIRQVLANDSLIFGGMGNTSNVIKLPHELNALQFTYSALYYEDHDKTQYSYFLEGFDPEYSGWSEWSLKTEKEYTNLPKGKYTFQVKAKNIYEKESTITQYKFKILPPWYRTIVAYIAYVVLAVLLIWLIVKLNTGRLKKDKEKLEKKVKIRTAEVVKQKEEITIHRDKIEKAYQNVKLLSEIGQQITVNLSVEKIIDTVYENVNALMDASAFGIGIYNKAKNQLEFPNFMEKGNKLAFSYDSLNETNRPSVKCFVNKEEVFITSFKEYTETVPSPPKVGELTESIIYLPLLAKDKKIGVITVQSFQKDAYTDYHLNILQNIAVYTSIALENAISYKKIENQKEIIEGKNVELEQQKEEILTQNENLESQKEKITSQRNKINESYNNVKLLSEIGKKIIANLKVKNIIEVVYGYINNLMDASTFAIGLYNAQLNTIVFYGLVESKGEILLGIDSLQNKKLLSSWCFNNQKEVLINDTSIDINKYVSEFTINYEKVPESLIYLPLTSGNKQQGVITIQSSRKNAYTNYHLDIFKSISVYVTIAIENAMAYKQVKKQMEEIETQKNELEKQRDIELNQKNEILAQQSEILEKTEELLQQKEELQSILDNLQQTQQQLVESKKMASLGSLVAGIAHEINTPVGVGIAASSTLVKKSKQIIELFEKKKMTIADLKNYVDSIKMASELILTNLQRTGELVKSFKQVSVDQSSENQRQFNLKSYLEDIIRSLHPKLTQKPVEVEINCPENIELNSYPGDFAQIITNMVINSLTHAFDVKSEGIITISAKTHSKNLILEYQDNGKGISPENLHRIFDPFFTTSMHEGTGLGLNIVYNLVTQKLKGIISCKSEINKGVLFIITIPLNLDI
ncbi:MAG: GAF domain-containing protein [Bacteroidales bacterium]|nr:GAF domain-containing protein [Bacteroidales bacterium]